MGRGSICRGHVLSKMHRRIFATGHRIQTDSDIARTGRSRRQAEQLYIAVRDVQTHTVNFFNKNQSERCIVRT